MKPILLSFLAVFALASTQPSPYIDLGVSGKSYEIVETDIRDEMQNASLNFSRDDLIAQLNIAATRSTQLPYCQLNEFVQELDTFVLATDIYNPAGRKLYSAGQVLPSKLPAGQSLDICFVGGLGVQINNEIAYMREKSPHCIFIVAGANVMDLRTKFGYDEIYPTSEQQERRFGLKCYPAIMRLHDDLREFRYYSIEQFKH